MHTEVTAVLTEKEEKGDSPKTEIEKEEAKDKIAQWQNLRVEADADGLLHVFGKLWETSKLVGPIAGEDRTYPPNVPIQPENRMWTGC